MRANFSSDLSGDDVIYSSDEKWTPDVVYVSGGKVAADDDIWRRCCSLQVEVGLVGFTWAIVLGRSGGKRASERRWRRREEGQEQLAGFWLASSLVGRLEQKTGRGSHM